MGIVETSSRPTALERGLLEDLCASGALTTEQVHRLRFPGTGTSNCRLRLMDLRRRGLVMRLECCSGEDRAVWWAVTAAGAAQVGRRPRGAWSPARLERRLAAGDRYVEETLARRVRMLGD